MSPTLSSLNPRSLISRCAPFCFDPSWLSSQSTRPALYDHNPISYRDSGFQVPICIWPLVHGIPDFPTIYFSFRGISQRLRSRPRVLKDGWSSLPLAISQFTISNSLVTLSSGFAKRRILIRRFGFPVRIFPNSLDCRHASSRDEQP
jgi:hypothetical protein